jgi:hypothetical protein
MERILIAEAGTDWLHALRCLSQAPQPFTTLVQAESAELASCPWGESVPREVVLLCAPELTAQTMASRMSLLRHLVTTTSPGATTFWMVVDAEQSELANDAFVDVVRHQLAPGFDVRATSLHDFTSRAA